MSEPPLTAKVETAVELRKLIADIRRQAEAREIAVAVSVVTPNDHVFTVSIGFPHGCILTYDGHRGDPPYLVSVGDPEKEEQLVSFCFMGEWSELPGNYVIPEPLALDGLVDCIENERPSPLIEWCGG
jgi:hypothetical protein